MPRGIRTPAPTECPAGQPLNKETEYWHGDEYQAKLTTTIGLPAFAFLGDPLNPNVVSGPKAWCAITRYISDHQIGAETGKDYRSAPCSRCKRTVHLRAGRSWSE